VRVDLLEVHWNAAHGTAVNQTRPATEERCVGVALEVGIRQVQVAEHQRLSVGRLPPCDLSLEADVQLSGRGLIGLGRAPSLNAPHTISYNRLTEETT